MKKVYQTPSINTLHFRFLTSLMEPSIHGDTGGGSGIGNGDDDPGGEGDPDAKFRGGLDGWGNLW